MRESLKRTVWLFAVMALVVSCGGASTGGVAEGAATASPASTDTAETAQTTTTTHTTTTTLPPTTTTSTIPPTPAESRSGFISSLTDGGWVEYEDSVIGWSILYPSGWDLVLDEPGSMVVVSPPDGGLLIVTMQQDALGDLGSYDYLQGNLEYSINEGVLNPNEKSDEFWLDHDFDGTRGPLDIAGVETSLTANPITGETVPEGGIAPSWWYGYYNPDLRPDYGYIFQTVGVSPALFGSADDVVLSFSPPENQGG
ncbi:MAG: hypothetical protein PVF87_10905 [Acidimicrobiia bacterium]|jgi:hypothetical protein